MSGFGDALRDVGWYDRMQNRSAQRNVQGAVSITGPVGSQRQRKAIYEELHPETRHGGDRKSDQVANSAIRFTATASEATGKSERTVRIAAARGEALGEDLATVTGTSLDKGVELDELRRSAAATTYPGRRFRRFAKIKSGDHERERSRHRFNNHPTSKSTAKTIPAVNNGDKPAK